MLSASRPLALFAFVAPLAVSVVTFASGCKRVDEAESRTASSSAPSSGIAPLASSAPHPVSAPAPLSPRISRPAPDRLVAIGDLHGDLDHARRAFRLAGAIDEHDRWIGGHLVIVQNRDEIDRGDGDRTIFDFVEAPKKQSPAAGGGFVALPGKHEGA